MTAVSLIRPDRSHEMDVFLASIGWEGAVRSMLAGDASFRRYERVVYGDTVAVLMDAPPPWEDVRPFLRVTHQLAQFGVSVPHIIAADDAQGFLLLEDLGDHSFTRLLKAEPAREAELYIAAVDALLAIQQASAPETEALGGLFPPYDLTVYLREAALFAEWLLPQVVGIARARELRAEYLDIWLDVLKATPLEQSTLVHRDYHADNLLWLNDRAGHLAVGMIDYQDALLGDPAYDMASLLEDARRDVSSETVAACTAHYLAASGVDAAGFGHRYAVLAAQRNAKIIGIFCRLAIRDGKTHYLSYLPRVWGHFLRDIEHPALASVRRFVEAHVPETFRGLFSADISIGGIQP